MERDSSTQGLLRAQCDWEEEFKLPGKTSFWVSYSTPIKIDSTASKNSYGKVVVTSSSLTEHLVDGTDGFTVIDYDKQNFSWFRLQSPDKTTISTFQCPRSSFTNLHTAKKSVNHVDISPKGELCVSGADGAQLKIWRVDNGELLRELKGHVGDVLLARFFPSGEVVLSADIQLKIWNALDGDCVATCSGHSMGVLDVSMIERGRNFISVSRDGTAKLWETGSQSVICSWGDYRNDKPKNCCWLTTNTQPTSSNREADSREVGTDGKLVLIGSDDKYLQGIDLRSQNETFRLPCKSGVNACTATDEWNYFCGTEDGLIYRFDAHNLSKPVSIARRSPAAITCMKPESRDQIWVTTADGLTFLWDIGLQKSIKELTGPDYERVTNISVRNGIVASTCRDGVVRLYQNSK